MTQNDPSLIVERRITVHGWKHEAGKRKEFAETSKLYDGSHSIAFQEGRIGEDVPNWQSHITGVVVEERIVSPWRETYRTEDV